eukprot:tig00001094_g6984.t1
MDMPMIASPGAFVAIHSTSHFEPLDQPLPSESFRRPEPPPETPSAPSPAPATPAELKVKIKQIHADPTISAQEKARKVQMLMAGKWMLKNDYSGYESPGTPTPGAPRRRADSAASQSEGAGAGAGEEEAITEEERAATYHTSGNLGCSHYRRNCKLRAKCCGKIFSCRFCHDEATGHAMDRYATEEMLCMHCKTLQPIAATCRSSKCKGKQMAKYYCETYPPPPAPGPLPVSTLALAPPRVPRASPAGRGAERPRGAGKFLDDDPEKEIYHCEHCNICRIGKGLGIDYFHCNKCNACMSTSLRNHRCVERSLESDCPICHHYMFTSTTPVMFLACGHCMHVACFEQYTMTNYVCPICSKSLGDMSAYFARLDEHLAQEQMPDEYSDMRRSPPPPPLPAPPPATTLWPRPSFPTHTSIRGGLSRGRLGGNGDPPTHAPRPATLFPPFPSPALFPPPSSSASRDWRGKSTAKFHFMYHKCVHCGSYNTKVLGHLNARVGS